jgi:beta-lactamase class D
MRGKTGWGFQDNKDIGWLIGWVEKSGNVFFFATNIESDIESGSFAAARRSITESILRDLGIIM